MTQIATAADCVTHLYVSLEWYRVSSTHELPLSGFIALVLAADQLLHAACSAVDQAEAHFLHKCLQRSQDSTLVQSRDSEGRNPTVQARTA